MRRRCVRMPRHIDGRTCIGSTVHEGARLKGGAGNLTIMVVLLHTLRPREFATGSRSLGAALKAEANSNFTFPPADETAFCPACPSPALLFFLAMFTGASGRRGILAVSRPQQQQ